MAITAKWFGNALLGQYSATAARRVDFLTDTMKVSLHTSTFVPDQDVHDFFDDATNEVVGTGYTAGGVTLGSKTLTYDSATNEIRLDAADAQWTSSTFTTRIAIVRKDTGSAATSPMQSYVDFGGDEQVTSGTYTIQWDATGAEKLTAS